VNPLMLSGLFNIGKSLIDRFFPDPSLRAAAQLELLKMQESGDLQRLAMETDLSKLQIQTNLEEAKSTNWFVAGWRPFIGWVCGAGLAYVAVIEPVARFIAQVWFNYTGGFPAIDTGITMQVLLGMLGLGAMRTYEKSNNSENKR